MPIDTDGVMPRLAGWWVDGQFNMADMLRWMFLSWCWRSSLKFIALGLSALAVVASLQFGSGAQSVTAVSACLLAGLGLKTALVAGTDRTVDGQIRVVSASLAVSSRSVDQVVQQPGAVGVRLDTAVADISRFKGLVDELGLAGATKSGMAAALADHVDEALARISIAQNEVLELRDLIVRVERRAPVALRRSA